ncbi:D-glycerate dehydrogenase [Mucilaginibacter gynuensis]|uniref:D-glycerate dehydrogenase n=1 Tax=Mucilaginibacter gynuensis TaxID=1302236 RepID=A0ABP8FNK6_9SPHI
MNVFITRVIPQKGLELLKAAGCTVKQHTEQRELSPEELIEQCRNQDVLLSSGPNVIDAHFLQTCRRLKGIALLSVGHDNVDLEAATRFGIPVSNTPDVLTQATADTAFLLMLAVSRNAFYMNESIKRGDWGFNEPTANLGRELYGKTLGVFGLGRIGSDLAAKCKAVYQMDIIYHNRKPNKEAEQILGARYVSFETLLQQSDVLSVHAGLSPETKRIFNMAAFKRMKPSSIFVNTARGGLHDEADLTAALQQQLIWGAGLDVTNPEPMAPDNPLLNMMNVCVLPHIGSATVETRDKMAIMAAENIIAAVEKRKMPQILNPEVYDKI